MAWIFDRYKIRSRLRAAVRGWSRDEIALGIVILLSVLAQRLWIARNPAPPELLDDANYLWASFVLYQALHQHGPWAFVKQFVRMVSHQFHPPLIPALTALLYLWSVPSLARALWINTLFLVVFYVYLFKLVKWWADARSALVAVTVTALFPMTYGLARLYMMELGLAALVVIWLYYFCRSAALADRRYWPGLGLLLTAGLLTKATFPMYIVGPVAWEILSRARADSQAAGRAAGRFLIVAGIGGLLALPWYWKHGDSAWQGAYQVVTGLGQTINIREMLAWPSLLYFFSTLLSEGISVYFFVLGLAMLAAFLLGRRRMPGHGAGFLLAWWLPPFLISGLMHVKVVRYLFPAFPVPAAFIGLLYGSLIDRRGTAFRCAWLLGAFLLIPLGNFFQLSFFDVWSRLPAAVLKRDKLGLLETAGGYEFTYRPRREPWSLDPILDVMRAHTSKRPPQEIEGGVYCDWYARKYPDACNGLWAPLTPPNLMFLGKVRNFPIGNFFPPCVDPALIVDCWQQQTTREFLILVRPTEDWADLGEALDAGRLPYHAVATVDLPVSIGARAVIYKRKPEESPEGSAVDPVPSR